MLTALDFSTILPEMMLAGSALALLMLGAFRGERSAALVTWLAVALCAAVFLLVLTRDPGAGRTAFNGVVRADGFGRYMKCLVMVGLAASLILGLDYNRREQIDRFEMPVLMVLSAAGMFTMIAANNLISLYIGLELQSLCLYVIAAFNRDSAKSSEAGLKYFVLGALSSGMLLYGASLIYGFCGSTQFEAIAQALQATAGAPLGILFGLIFLISGIAFKISAVPFHMWTPDVYEGSPTPVTAFFSVAPKVAAIALFIRVLTGPFAGMIGDWRQIIVFISIASMLLGSFAAINQSNIKRLMAYSSIGHMGYALIGLAAGDRLGVRGIIIYMAIYIVMSLGAFGCIIAMRLKGRQIEEISELAGLSRTHPLMALAFGTFMFSMAGIPPMAGFFAKLFIFQAAVDNHLFALAVIGVLTSVVGAYYYLRIVKLMYFDDPTGDFAPMDRSVAAITAVAALINFFFFAWPNAIVGGAGSAAAGLFGG